MFKKDIAEQSKGIGRLSVMRDSNFLYNIYRKSRINSHQEDSFKNFPNHRGERNTSIVTWGERVFSFTFENKALLKQLGICSREIIALKMFFKPYHQDGSSIDVPAHASAG